MTKDIVNPNGYFENDRLTKLHDDMLSYNGLCWYNVKGFNLKYNDRHIKEYLNIIRNDFSEKKIVIKDPRLSFFNSFCKIICEKLSAKPFFMFATRNKKEIIKSLSKAQNKSKNICEELHDNTEKCLMKEMLVVSYNDHMTNDKKIQLEICKYLGEPYEYKSVVDPKLWRNK